MLFYIGCRKSDVYGNKCDTQCPAACKDSICNIQNGSCFECKHGQYGGYCNISCPINCKDNACQILNGTCFTCKPGWTGMFCERSKQAYRTMCMKKKTQIICSVYLLKFLLFFRSFFIFCRNNILQKLFSYKVSIYFSLKKTLIIAFNIHFSNVIFTCAMQLQSQ